MSEKEVDCGDEEEIVGEDEEEEERDDVDGEDGVENAWYAVKKAYLESGEAGVVDVAAVVAVDGKVGRNLRRDNDAVDWGSEVVRHLPPRPT